MLPFLSALLSASLASESFSQAACAADGPPPTFALLLVGNFRTFYDPRVYKSIRTNLIDALGERPIRSASRAESIILYSPRLRSSSFCCSFARRCA